MEDGRYIGLIKSVPTFIIRLYYELELLTNVADPSLPRSSDYLTHHSLRTARTDETLNFQNTIISTKYNYQEILNFENDTEEIEPYVSSTDRVCLHLERFVH